jgi:thiol-disulfide isomerase/thioredoxin
MPAATRMERTRRRGAARLLLAIMAASVLFTAGCNGRSSTGASVAAAPPSAPTADAAAFLKWSMDRHAALNSLRAKCNWSMGGSTNATRALVYAKPNKFKVVSTMPSGGDMTAVSDGANLLEYSSGDKETMSQAAPASIDKVGSMFMQHLMFCGSLIYQFFGGSTNYDKLVDTAKGAPTFAEEITFPDGTKCKTVRFSSKGTYGTTNAVIGVADGLVRIIRYDNEPLLAMAGDRIKGQPGFSPSQVMITEAYEALQPDAAIQAGEFGTKLPKNRQVQKMPSMGGPEPPVPLGKAAPAFKVASVKEGTSVPLSSLRGQVVLIDFWATWCPPCRKGLPETQRLHDVYGKKGLAVLAVTNEDKATVQAFMKENSYHFPAYLDKGNAAMRSYGIQSIPTVAVIDRQGRLSDYMVGLQQPETLLAALKKAGLAVQ